MNKKITLFLVMFLSIVTNSVFAQTDGHGVVPEPISSALFLIGAGALAARYYHKKRQKS